MTEAKPLLTTEVETLTTIEVESLSTTKVESLSTSEAQPLSNTKVLATTTENLPTTTEAQPPSTIGAQPPSFIDALTLATIEASLQTTTEDELLSTTGAITQKTTEPTIPMKAENQIKTFTIYKDEPLKTGGAEIPAKSWFQDTFANRLIPMSLSPYKHFPSSRLNLENAVRTKSMERVKVIIDRFPVDAPNKRFLEEIEPKIISPELSSGPAKTVDLFNRDAPPNKTNKMKESNTSFSFLPVSAVQVKNPLDNSVSTSTESLSSKHIKEPSITRSTYHHQSSDVKSKSVKFADNQGISDATIAGINESGTFAAVNASEAKSKVERTHADLVSNGSGV